jgi:hypothetical protein
MFLLGSGDADPDDDELGDNINSSPATVVVIPSTCNPFLRFLGFDVAGAS